MQESIRIACLVLFFLAPAMVNASEVYKWVDEEGRTHYGEKPSGENAQSMDIREGPDNGNEQRDHEVDQERFLQVLEEEREEKRAQKRKLKEEKKLQAERCARIRDRLAYLEQGSVFYRDKEGGERDYLSEEEVQAEFKKLQEAREKVCN